MLFRSTSDRSAILKNAPFYVNSRILKVQSETRDRAGLIYWIARNLFENEGNCGEFKNALAQANSSELPVTLLTIDCAIAAS